MLQFPLQYNLKFLPARLRLSFSTHWGFPCGLDGKESACNAGDPGSIPGSGRYTGEGIGYSFQYSWASLVAQWLVKNPPAMWETWIRSLGWEDPLEKGKATHTSTLAWKIPWTLSESDMTERLSLSLLHCRQILYPLSHLMEAYKSLIMLIILPNVYKYTRFFFKLKAHGYPSCSYTPRDNWIYSVNPQYLSSRTSCWL